MSEPLAHSARHGAPTQSYHDHVSNVVSGAVARSERMLQHYEPAASWIGSPAMLEIVRSAARFHDLGKLDSGFQKTLRTNRTSEEHIRHEDAGVAWLLANGADEAAGLVSAHHQGLVRYLLEVAKDRPEATGRLEGTAFRINEDKTAKATAASLESYLKGHEDHYGPRTVEPEQHENKLTGLSRRFLLSCLVDADHSDTATHYGNEPAVSPPVPRWGSGWRSSTSMLPDCHAPIQRRQHRRSWRGNAFVMSFTGSVALLIQCLGCGVVMRLWVQARPRR